MAGSSLALRQFGSSQTPHKKHPPGHTPSRGTWTITLSHMILVAPTPRSLLAPRRRQPVAEIFSGRQARRRLHLARGARNYAHPARKQTPRHRRPRGKIPTTSRWGSFNASTSLVRTFGAFDATRYTESDTVEEEAMSRTSPRRHVRHRVRGTKTPI